MEYYIYSTSMCKILFEIKKTLLYFYNKVRLFQCPPFVMVGLFLIQVLFLGIGLLLGAVAKRSKEGTAIGSAIILGTFLLKVIIDLKKDLDWLDGFTPFRYFQSNDLMFKQHLEAGFGVLTGILVVVTIALTFYFFKKRDLRN